MIDFEQDRTQTLPIVGGLDPNFVLGLHNRRGIHSSEERNLVCVPCYTCSLGLSSCTFSEVLVEVRDIRQSNTM